MFDKRSTLRFEEDMVRKVKPQVGTNDPLLHLDDAMIQNACSKSSRISDVSVSRGVGTRAMLLP